MARTRMANDPKMIDSDPELAGGAPPAPPMEEPYIDPAASLPPGALPPAESAAIAAPGIGASEIGRQIETLTRRVNDMESLIQQLLPQIVQTLAIHDQAIQEIVSAAMQAMGGLPPGAAAPAGGPPPGGPPPGGPPPGPGGLIVPPGAR